MVMRKQEGAKLAKYFPNEWPVVIAKRLTDMNDGIVMTKWERPDEPEPAAAPVTDAPAVFA